MNYHKSDLIDLLQKNSGITKAQAKDQVENFLDAVNTLTALDDSKLTLRGFGVFQKVHRPARIARNPQTGASVQVAAKSTLRFKAAK